jgi:DNA invertase Pin-like site-specific DNA recombinase
LDHIREGDTLIDCKWDRLTRSLVDLLDILKKLENAGASFHSLGETFETQSAAGRMMMNMVLVALRNSSARSSWNASNGVWRTPGRAGR